MIARGNSNDRIEDRVLQVNVRARLRRETKWIHRHFEASREIVRHEVKVHSAVATLVPIVAAEAMLEVIAEEAFREAVVAVSGVAVADAEESAGWFR